MLYMYIYGVHFGRISCDFRLDNRDFGKKNVRSRETRKNQGNLETAVKGNSHRGLAGIYVSRSLLIMQPSGCQYIYTFGGC